MCTPTANLKGPIPMGLPELKQNQQDKLLLLLLFV